MKKLIPALFVLVALAGCGRTSTNDTNSEVKGEPVRCTTTMTTTTATTSTKKTTVTTTTTATSSTTTIAPLTTKAETCAYVAPPTEAYVAPTEYTTIIESPTEYTAPATEPPAWEYGYLPITETELILLENLLSHEAGSSWIDEYERACIVAAVMNRVADSRFPNTIDEVVHQPGQMFDVPYYRVDYSGIGFEAIDNAIYSYFNGTYDCGNINSWTGDGRHNHFYYQ